MGLVNLSDKANMISDDKHKITPELSRQVPEELKLKGVSGSRGYAIGPAFVYKRLAIEIENRTIDESEVVTEIEKLNISLEKSEKELKKISSITSQKLGDEFSAIFEAQILMLHDPESIKQVKAKIREKKICAEESTNRIFTKNIELLLASNDAYLSQRAQDLEDVKFRIIRNMQRGKLLSKVDEQSIIVADNLTPADMILFSRQNIKAIVLDFGGVTSHVSLIARSLNIPLVLGLHKVTQIVQPDDLIIVDGINGSIIINPEQENKDGYLRKIEAYKTFQHLFDEKVKLPAKTVDGEVAHLYANIEFRDEIPDLGICGAEGIGLYRTEHLFLSRGDFPTEKEQIIYYQSLFKMAGKVPVTVRAFDIGGDKVLSNTFREMNPFLGWRGIRILLDRQDIFRHQLRAIILSAQGRSVRLMFPMINDVHQLREIKKIIQTIYEEFEIEGKKIQQIPIGAMIEIPSAAIMSYEIAGEVDFLSIGTNDLTQYTLAVDRVNDIISDMYRELDPAVLRLIHWTIQSGKKRNIPVSLCGEMASDVLNVPLLLGMGLREFSTVIRRIPEIKYVIQNIHLSECEALAKEVLLLDSWQTIEIKLRQWFTDHLPEFKDYI